MAGEKQIGFAYHMEGKTLVVSCRARVVNRITLWPRPLAEDWSGVSREPERMYPEFRVIDYPLRAKKQSAPPRKETAQLELGFEAAQRAAGPLTKKQAYDQLRKTMPFSYALALAVFKSHQWYPLIFLSMNRSYYDLLKSNPVLAYLLANSEYIRGQVFYRRLMLTDLCGMKQTALLDCLGLPTTKQVVGIFRAIQPAFADPTLLWHLEDCAKDPAALKKLSHVKSINLGVLALLAKLGGSCPQVTPQLLEDVARDRGEAHYAATAQRLDEAMRWHRELFADRRFPVVRDCAAVQAYHHELATRVQEQLAAAGVNPGRHTAEYLNKILTITFGPPPLAGTDGIRPLTEARELLEEGARQHNCVGSYVQRVKAGHCYIYAVEGAERATLSVVRGSGGWRIGELSAACNQPVRAATRNRVEAWLAQGQLGL